MNCLSSWPLISTVFLLLIGQVSLAEDQPKEAVAKPPIPVWRLDFSPDGSLLAAAAGERNAQGLVRVWNTKTWEVVFEISEKHALTCVAFSPDGKSLAIGTQSGEIFTVETATQKPIARWESGQWAVFGVTWTPDSQSVVGALANGGIKVWQAQSGDLQIAFDVWEADQIKNTKPGGHADRNQWDVAVTADGKTLFSGGWNDTTRIWSLETKEMIHQFSDNDHSTQGVNLMPDERHFVATGLGFGSVKIRDTVTFRERMTLPVVGRDVAVHPDGELIAASSMEDVYVFRVQLDPLTPEVALRARAYVQQIGVGEESEQEAAVAKLEELGPSIEPVLHYSLLDSRKPSRVLQTLWLKSRTPEKVAQLKGLSGEPRQVAFSPTGDLLAASTISGEIQIWSVPKFAPVKKFTITIPK